MDRDWDRALISHGFAVTASPVGEAKRGYDLISHGLAVTASPEGKPRGYVMYGRFVPICAERGHCEPEGLRL